MDRAHWINSWADFGWPSDLMNGQSDCVCIELCIGLAGPLKNGTYIYVVGVYMVGG